MDIEKTPKITGPAYRFPKEYKMLLAGEVNPHQRGALKRALIKADVESRKAPPPLKKGKDKEEVAE